MRNGLPFLTAHISIRSTFLRNAYVPWLKDAAMVCLLALGGAVLLAIGISAVASRPIEQIGRKLEMISTRSTDEVRPVEVQKHDVITRVSSTACCRP